MPPLLQRLELFNGDGQALRGGLPLGAPLKVRVGFLLEKPSSVFNITLDFRTLLGQSVLIANSDYEPERPFEEHSGEQIFVCEIPSFTLVPGEYRIRVDMFVNSARVDRVDEAARLTVIASDYYGTGKLPQQGACVIQQHWQLE